MSSGQVQSTWRAVEALPLLLAISLAVKVRLPLRWLLAIGSRAPRDRRRPGEVAGAVASVDLAGRFLRDRPACLARSVTLQWLLAGRGVHSDLRVGVRRRANGLEAHAWVEVGGVVVNDSAQVISQYTPFAGPITNAGLFDRFSASA